MSKAIKNNLKIEWEMFCQYFACDYETFGNATKAYAKAYNIDISDKSKYASCRSQGYRLLTNDDILRRINELLSDIVMNNTTVDMQLAFLITQMSDYGAKIQAIREYNKLKQRITDRLEVSDTRKDILERFGIHAGETPEAEKSTST